MSFCCDARKHVSRGQIEFKLYFDRFFVVAIRQLSLLYNVMHFTPLAGVVSLSVVCEENCFSNQKVFDGQFMQ